MCSGAGRDVWYVGGVSGETAPQAYVITVFEANSETQIPIRMARSSGFALSLREYSH